MNDETLAGDHRSRTGAEPFEPPAWRAQWVERIEPDRPTDRA